MNFVRVRRKDLTSFKQVQIRFHYNLSHSHVLGNFIQIKHGMKLALSKLNCFQKYLTFDVNWLPWKMILHITFEIFLVFEDLKSISVCLNPNIYITLCQG